MKTFQLPAILDSFRSLKDRTIKLTFETAELSPEQIMQIAASSQQAGYLAFNPDPFSKQRIEEIEGLKVEFSDTGKSKGKRLRAVLYRVYEQNSLGYEVFDDFYNFHMEKIITHYKSKLD